MPIEDYEPIVQQCARRYARDPELRSEYAQLVRIAIWLALEKDPSLPENHAIVIGRSAIFHMLEKQERQKRTPPGGALLELQAPLFETGGLTVEDSVGRSDCPGHGLLLAEMHEQLRSRFGRYYSQGIAQSGLRGIPQAIVRTTLEQVAGIDPHDTDAYANFQFFAEHGLHPLLRAFFRGSYHVALSACYPDFYVPWMGSNVPPDYWSGRYSIQHATKAMQWFCDLHDLTTVGQARSVVTMSNLKASGLGGLAAHYHENTARLIQLVFSEARPWRLKHVPHGFWDSDDNRFDALDDFLQHVGCGSIVGLTPEATYDKELKKRVSRRTLTGFHLSNLLASQYDGRQYDMFHDIFPGQILPWTLAQVRISSWPDAQEVGVNAMRWVVEDYLGLSCEELPAVLTDRLMKALGFSGIMRNPVFGFENSPFRIADALYPGTFTPDDFSRFRPCSRIPDCGYLSS